MKNDLFVLCDEIITGGSLSSIWNWIRPKWRECFAIWAEECSIITLADLT